MGSKKNHLAELDSAFRLSISYPLVVEGELQLMHISALCHGIDAELQS